MSSVPSFSGLGVLLSETPSLRDEGPVPTGSAIVNLHQLSPLHLRPRQMLIPLFWQTGSSPSAIHLSTLPPRVNTSETHSHPIVTLLNLVPPPAMSLPPQTEIQMLALQSQNLNFLLWSVSVRQ